MKFSVLLVTCFCSLGQITSRTEWRLAPQLTPGLELVYVGTYSEEHLIPRVQFQAQYGLESRVLVLDTGPRRENLALMTSLSQRLPRADTGVKENKTISVRLELGCVDAQGRVTDLAGGGLLLALTGPPTSETGAFVEFPTTKLKKGDSWEVNEDARPPRSWQVQGLEAVGPVTCVKLVGQQQSPDWDKPRGDQTAWRRRDVVWINPQLGVAEKVERVIEQRDPLRRDPTHRATVQYVLENKFRYSGRFFDDRKQEIAKARKFQDEAAALLRQPVQHQAQVDGLIKKVSLHVENQAPTPYRKAVIHLASRLEQAKNGTAAAADPVRDDPPLPSTTVGIGQRVPDFVARELSGKQSARLSRLLGRPVLVFFYSPTSDLGKEVLQFAKALTQQHGDKLAVMAMAVTNDADFALKQQTSMQLPFAILDGRGMHLTFGVKDTPRLVLLDGDGIVRSAHTGWAYQVPREIQDELQHWLRK